MKFSDEFAAAGDQVAAQIRAKRQAQADAATRHHARATDKSQKFATHLGKLLEQQPEPTPSQTSGTFEEEFSAFIRAQH